MRPIAALARVPLRFPEAIVASPGQFSMQHRLPGEDPTVGPNPRGRSTARPLRAAEQQDAGAVAGGDCRRAVDQAGGDGGPSGGVSRESRASPHAEPATAHSPRRSPGGVGGGMGRRGRRPGSCPRGGVAQFANLDKDPMERRAVGLAAGRAAGVPTGHLTSGRVAQFTNRDKDPTERCAVGLAAERAGGVATRHLPPGRVAPCANLDKDPMDHRVEGLAEGRDPGIASQGHLPSGEWRNSLISTKTLWNAARWAWRQDGRPGRRPRTCPRGDWRNSEISTKTLWNTARWRLAAGRSGGDAGREPGPERVVQFGSLGHDPCNSLPPGYDQVVAWVGLAGRTEGRGASQELTAPFRCQYSLPLPPLWPVLFRMQSPCGAGRKRLT